jgi:hypothetical protein
VSTDLVELLEKKSIPYKNGGEHRHVRYGWIGLQCPWCQTSSWHLGVRISDGYCSCWRCGRHKFTDVLSEITGERASSFFDALKQFQRGRRYEDEARVRGTLSLPSGITTLDQLPLHQKYLISRGFDPSYLESIWNVKGIGLAPRLQGRLFLPITMNRSVVSWTTRAIGDREPRYISAAPSEERYPHKTVLYGGDLVERDAVIVCEGPTDAWRIGPGAVATFGVNVSEDQLFEIGSYPMRTICFDNTDEAQRRAAKLCARLCTFTGMSQRIELDSGEDPASADASEIALLRKSAGLSN